MTSKPLKILSHFTLTFICLFCVSLVTSSRSKAPQPLSVAVFAHARVREKQTWITLLSAGSLSSSQLVVWSNHPFACCCLAPEGSHAPPSCWQEIRNQSHECPFKVAKYPENRNRNRYRDVSPCRRTVRTLCRVRVFDSWHLMLTLSSLALVC